MCSNIWCPSIIVSYIFINDEGVWGEMVAEFLTTAESYITRLVIGFVILLVGLCLGILVRKIVYKILQRVELNSVLAKAGIIHDVESAISLVVAFVIYLVTLVIFLNQLGITSVVVYIVLGAILMLIVLTFVVSLKDVSPNAVAWVVLMRLGKIKVGSKVEVCEIKGVVERIGLLETEIKTGQGDVLYVPNSLFVKQKMWVREDE